MKQTATRLGLRTIPFLRGWRGMVRGGLMAGLGTAYLAMTVLALTCVLHQVEPAACDNAEVASAPHGSHHTTPLAAATPAPTESHDATHLVLCSCLDKLATLPISPILAAGPPVPLPNVDITRSFPPRATDSRGLIPVRGPPVRFFA